MLVVEAGEERDEENLVLGQNLNWQWRSGGCSHGRRCADPGVPSTLQPERRMAHLWARPTAPPLHSNAAAAPSKCVYTAEKSQLRLTCLTHIIAWTQMNIWLQPLKRGVSIEQYRSSTPGTQSFTTDFASSRDSLRSFGRPNSSSSAVPIAKCSENSSNMKRRQNTTHSAKKKAFSLSPAFSWESCRQLIRSFKQYDNIVV